MAFFFRIPHLSFAYARKTKYCAVFCSVFAQLNRPASAVGKCKQDEKNAAFSQGAYFRVRNQEKTQVRRSIAKYFVGRKLDGVGASIINPINQARNFALEVFAVAVEV